MRTPWPAYDIRYVQTSVRSTVKFIMGQFIFHLKWLISVSLLKWNKYFFFIKFNFKFQKHFQIGQILSWIFLNYCQYTLPSIESLKLKKYISITPYFIYNSSINLFLFEKQSILLVVYYLNSTYGYYFTNNHHIKVSNIWLSHFTALNLKIILFCIRFQK
jgi:hypothetical protein